MNDLQPDIAGYMASLGTTNTPLAMCHSCQRALIYGTMLNAGTVKAHLDEVVRAIQSFDPVKAVQFLHSAQHRAAAVLQLLADFVKIDLIGSLPGALDLSDEDWKIAMNSFFTARCEAYVDEQGQIKFESHEGHCHLGGSDEGEVTV